MKTEYFAKFIRDSSASVGHGIMLDELNSIERSLREELRFLGVVAPQVSVYALSPSTLTDSNFYLALTCSTLCRTVPEGLWLSFPRKPIVCSSSGLTYPQTRALPSPSTGRDTRLSYRC